MRENILYDGSLQLLNPCMDGGHACKLIWTEGLNWKEGLIKNQKSHASIYFVLHTSSDNPDLLF
jgi:hypothetical protein